MKETFADLKDGVVLAELGGYGDGPYCAKHGMGAALVMMGTYIVDEGTKVPYPPQFVFKPDKAVYLPYLRQHVAEARAGGARVGVSVISVELSHSMEFLAAVQEAGADYASICAHSSMEMFARAGVDQAHFVRRGSPALARWARAARDAVSIPVIFKIGQRGPEDTLAAVETLAKLGIPVVHINVGAGAPGSEGLQTIGRLRGVCACLIAGGGIGDAKDARRFIQAGADAVAIGRAAMRDPALCGRIQQALREKVEKP